MGAVVLADIANESKTSLGEMEQLFTGAEQAMLRTLKETEGGMAAQAAAIEMLNKQFALPRDVGQGVDRRLCTAQEQGRRFRRGSRPGAAPVSSARSRWRSWGGSTSWSGGRSLRGTSFSVLGKKWKVVHNGDDRFRWPSSTPRYRNYSDFERLRRRRWIVPRKDTRMRLMSWRSP